MIKVLREETKKERFYSLEELEKEKHIGLLDAERRFWGE